MLGLPEGRREKTKLSEVKEKKFGWVREWGITRLL
jgi:hypothetical protein